VTALVFLGIHVGWMLAAKVGTFKIIAWREPAE
jgi:hypothetical protein